MPAARTPAKQVSQAPFLAGTQEVWEGNDYDQTLNNSAGAVNGPPWALQATGWLRGLFLLITSTGLTAGTVVADGPAIILQNIELDDVNNEAIFGPFDGYTAALTNKYGGYYFVDDPFTVSTFSYTGTVSTNNITFMLYIPLEIVDRDPVGDVASVNNTASLILKYTLNPQTSVFTTITGTMSTRVRGSQDFYWQPKATDSRGNPVSPEPVASGTTQYWTQGSFAVAGAGVINQPMPTGLGYDFRNQHFLLRDATGSRANGETNWPDPLIALRYEANMLLSNINKVLWQTLIAREWGHFSGTADTRGAGTIPGKENGVYPNPYNNDFFLHRPGGETRRTYLPTSPGSNMIFNGNMGGAGTLYEIVNYVARGGGAAARRS